MDTEKLAAFLINGALIRILKVGKTLPTVAWIVRDDEMPSGFRLRFDSSMEPQADACAGRLIPANHWLDGKFTKPSKDDIIQYLALAFGLRREQAARVVAEARAESPAFAPQLQAR